MPRGQVYCFYTLHKCKKQYMLFFWLLLFFSVGAGPNGSLNEGCRPLGQGIGLHVVGSIEVFLPKLEQTPSHYNWNEVLKKIACTLPQRTTSTDTELDANSCFSTRISQKNVKKLLSILLVPRSHASGSSAPCQQHSTSLVPMQGSKPAPLQFMSWGTCCSWTPPSCVCWSC